MRSLQLCPVLWAFSPGSPCWSVPVLHGPRKVRERASLIGWNIASEGGNQLVPTVWARKGFIFLLLGPFEARHSPGRGAADGCSSSKFCPSSRPTAGFLPHGKNRVHLSFHAPNLRELSEEAEGSLELL